MKNYTKGFTLIELLVVIAIIGILSSVVLVSLGTARNKGKDAAVQSQLGSVRAQMELFASGNSTGYTGGCTALGSATPPGASTILDGVKNSSAFPSQARVNALATAGAYNQVTCHESANGGAWVAEGPMSASTSAAPSMWCVDSAGKSVAESAPMLANATACL